MNEEKQDKRPLAGIKVLDLTMVGAGPMCTTILADLGANVIKVERPDGGDLTRVMDVSYRGGESGFFLGVNKGKRSITVDLKSDEGRKLVHRLVKGCDVFAESFRIGVADRLGLGYEALRGRNPKLVYLSITGYGPRGPLKDKPAFDIIVQALTGMMDITGESDRGPAKVGPPVADIATGVYAALGIVSALYARQITGQGQRVETSLLGSGLSLSATFLAGAALGTAFRREGSQHSILAPYQAFKGKDERYFVVAASTEHHWERLCRVLGRPDLLDMSEYKTNALRVKNKQSLTLALQSQFQQNTADHWIHLIEKADIPVALVSNYMDVMKNEQIITNGYIKFFDDENVVGGIPVVVTPLHFSSTEIGSSLPPPRLGEHNEFIRDNLWDKFDSQ